MAKKTQYFEHESLQDRDAVVNYLHALANAVKTGEILLSDGDEKQIMQPSDLTLMSLKASSTKKSQSLRIKLTWNKQTDEEPDNEPLFIKAKKAKKPKKS
ncbi:hypothetical protein THMIRHAS_05270 [Thiosulfatimonas sediminis]|uniref:Amphi-Trp domain-containing protein n=1 Tax=Thiosulfatimonas sediminis TaxID=2675054 RepID=A0A6F8PT01_9GAMM|nr:amphi-Trp domain-containing protein [Thiosulfatimonas sediminis]BBP45154.1 hypothetical protein THMIRHAS_05270 [Thiosulfatimonas sediminis]